MLHAYRNPLRYFEVDDDMVMFVGGARDGTPIEVGRRTGRPVDHRPRHAARPPKVSEVMPMPRTVEEIAAQAEALAKRFEDFEPVPGSAKDAAALRAVREAFEDYALAQKRLAERVSVAKAMGHSWAAIGAMLGTSGEAARQRYGRK